MAQNHADLLLVPLGTGFGQDAYPLGEGVDHDADGDPRLGVIGGLDLVIVDDTALGDDLHHQQCLGRVDVIRTPQARIRAYDGEIGTVPVVLGTEEDADVVQHHPAAFGDDG